MSGYRYVLDETVVEAMTAQPLEVQRAWLQMFRALAPHPFKVGEFRIRDAEGRILESIVMGDLVVTFWADHGAKEIRIVEVL